MVPCVRKVRESRLASGLRLRHGGNGEAGFSMFCA
jgi:hypothetical protein